MAKTTTKSNNKKESNDDTGDVSVSEQLERAHVAISKNSEAMSRLHAQWKLHLLRLSYLIIIITFQSAQSPMTECMKDIKKWNKLQSNSMEEPMSGYKAMIVIMKDSIVELLSIICASGLAWCLTLKIPSSQSEFVTTPYQIATVCVFMIISLYFNNKTHGCLPEEATTTEQFKLVDTNDEKLPRTFPVVLVYHTIATIALLFMQFQKSQQNKNIEMILKLKQDLTEAHNESKNSKKKK